MRTALAMISLAFLSGPALAHGPFDGRWGLDEVVCATERGTSDLIPTEIHAPDIRYYESACTIEDMVPVGSAGPSWRAEVSCSGEGETWTRDVIFALDHGTGERRPQLIEIDMETGAVTVQQSCDWTPPGG